MRLATISSLATSAMFCAAAAFAGPQGHSAPAPAGHTAPTATHAPVPATTAHGHSAPKAGPAVAHGEHHASTSATHAGKPTRSATHSTTTSGATTTHTGTHTTTSPIATKIQSHPKLAAKVTALLPPGMTLQRAARGFKNQGQFIAALHVSQNLGIPFADLKKQMVTNHSSLGQAIQKLRPAANASTEAEHGETEADHDVRTTTTTTTPTTTHAKHDR